LNAIQIVVHVSGSGSGWWWTTNTGNHPISSWPHEYSFSVGETAGATFTCYGENGLTNDTDTGTLNPYEVNHFYLDLTGAEPEPDPEPNND
jgi:hypothetical protein